MASDAGMGLPCPKCNSTIRPTVENILFDKKIRCASCESEFPANVPEAQAEKLRAYYESQKAQEAKKSNE